jgi:hypothetical protein
MGDSPSDLNKLLVPDSAYFKKFGSGDMGTSLITNFMLKSREQYRDRSDAERPVLPRKAEKPHLVTTDTNATLLRAQQGRQSTILATSGTGAGNPQSNRPLTGG